MDLIFTFGSACVLGILTGMGIGGGSLLLLFLTMVLHTDPGEARTISLLFFFPASILACYLNRKTILWKRIFPGAAAGILTAAFFSVLAPEFSSDFLKNARGLLFLITGFRELFHK